MGTYNDGESTRQTVPGECIPITRYGKLEIINADGTIEAFNVIPGDTIVIVTRDTEGGKQRRRPRRYHSFGEG